MLLSRQLKGAMESVPAQIPYRIDGKNAFNGYANTIEDVLDAVKDYELQTTTKFTIYKKTKAFGRSGNRL